jgi:hypothetical protein
MSKHGRSARTSVSYKSRTNGASFTGYDPVSKQPFFKLAAATIRKRV